MVGSVSDRLIDTELHWGGIHPPFLKNPPSGSFGSRSGIREWSARGVRGGEASIGEVLQLERTSSDFRLVDVGVRRIDPSARETL